MVSSAISILYYLYLAIGVPKEKALRSEGIRHEFPTFGEAIFHA